MKQLLFLAALVVAALSAEPADAPVVVPEGYDAIPAREMRVPAIIKSETGQLGMRKTQCLLQGSVAGLWLLISIEGDGPLTNLDDVKVIARASDGTALPLERMWAVRMATDSFWYHLTIPYGSGLEAVEVMCGPDEVVLEMTDRRTSEYRKATDAEPVAPHEPPPRASVSHAQNDRTLDSLPASGSSGGR